jgi:hypothetical protein
MLSGTHSKTVDAQVGEVNGFYPVLEVSDFQEVMRAPTDLASATMINYLVVARAVVNFRLSDFRKDKESQEITKLANIQRDINDPKSISGSEYVMFYKMAIYNFAVADMQGFLVTLHAREDAIKKADKLSVLKSEYKSEGDRLLDFFLSPYRFTKKKRVYSTLV